MSGNYSTFDPFAANDEMNKIFSPTVSLLLRLFVILYVSHIAPNLPDHILKYFTYGWFKIIYMALIVWLMTHDPLSSLLLATAFLATVNIYSGRKPFDAFKDIHNWKNTKDKNLNKKINIIQPHGMMHTLWWQDLGAFTHCKMKIGYNFSFDWVRQLLCT